MSQQTKLEESPSLWYISKTTPTCPYCGDTFDTVQGVINHYTRLHERPYPWIPLWRCEYCSDDFRRKRTTGADSGKPKYCSKECAGKDNEEPEKPVPFRLENAHGYPGWRTSEHSTTVHQLVAVADGADPYNVYGDEGHNVHHKNGIKIDNRHENLEVLSSQKHGKLDGAKDPKQYTYSDLLTVVYFMLGRLDINRD